MVKKIIMSFVFRFRSSLFVLLIVLLVVGSVVGGIFGLVSDKVALVLTLTSVFRDLRLV